MFKQITLSLFLFFGMITSNAQTVTGKWYSVDADTDEKKSIIEVYKQDGRIYAKILELIKDEDKGKLCDKCEGDNYNKPIEGMIILNGLSQDGNEWSGGKILDPKNGSLYKCYIELVEKNKLKIRGYIGFSLIGRTEYWYREK